MTQFPRIFIGIFLSFILSNVSLAASLCDAACDFNISFPDGGVITADEPVKLSFGEGAFINNGSSIVGYAATQTLSLSAGESLTFGDGGNINLGDQGNVDYSSMSITSNGVFELGAIEGLEKIYIYNLNLNGSMTFVVNSDVEGSSTGILNLSDVTLNLDTQVIFTSPVTMNISAGTFGGSGTLVNEGNLSISDNSLSQCSSELTTDSGAISINSGIVSTVPVESTCQLSFSNDVSLVTTNSLESIDISQFTIQQGSLSLNENIDPELFMVSMSGQELQASDGASCTVVESQCITSNGAVYVLKNGELVAAEEGNSGFSMMLILVMPLLAIIQLAIRSRIVINRI